MQILRRIPYWATIALLVYMPFHVFLAQSLSLMTGGLEVWKVAKDVLLAGVVVFTICMVWRQKLGDRLFVWLFALSVLYFGLHLLLWAFHTDIHGQSAALGLVYNMRLPCFLLLGYGAKLLNADKFVFSSFIRICLMISTVVAALGVLQYVLPKDVLTHLGYSLDRGVRPAFFIDDHPDLPRIMSTLREPNALAAYLILPFAALALLALRVRDARRRIVLVSAWALHLLAIVLTFSRSAWLGALLAVVIVVWWQCSSVFVRFAQRWRWAVIALVLFVSVTGPLLLNSRFAQSYITHSTPEAVQDLDSNDYHWLFIRRGIEGIMAQPFGHGPGTAGLASIQNPNGSFLTENYYVQIGYELGLVGLSMFFAISVLVYRAVYRRRDYIAVILLASFWAYVITNMLLHTWGNEAVAAQWWILAGLSLGALPVTFKTRVDEQKPGPHDRMGRMGVFDKIYTENTWLVGSGMGSLPKPTKGYRTFLQQFIKEHNVQSVVDFGCGDWQFSKLIDWTGVDYKGYDIVKPVVAHNKQAYAKPGIQFFESPADWTKLPKADLLVTKDVLQHFSNEDVQRFLNSIQGKYKFLLITNGTNPPERMNADIQTGEYRPLDIRLAPFSVDAKKVYSFKGPKELKPKPWPFRSYWYKDVLLVEE